MTRKEKIKLFNMMLDRKIPAKTDSGQKHYVLVDPMVRMSTNSIILQFLMAVQIVVAIMMVILTILLFTFHQNSRDLALIMSALTLLLIIIVVNKVVNLRFKTVRSETLRQLMFIDTACYVNGTNGPTAIDIKFAHEQYVQHGFKHKWYISENDNRAVTDD